MSSQNSECMNVVNVEISSRGYELAIITMLPVCESLMNVNIIKYDLGFLTNVVFYVMLSEWDGNKDKLTYTHWFCNQCYISSLFSSPYINEQNRYQQCQMAFIIPYTPHTQFLSSIDYGASEASVVFRRLTEMS